MCPYKTKDEDKFERHQGSAHRLKCPPGKGAIRGGQTTSADRSRLSCEHCDFTADLAQNLRTHALSCLGLARRKIFRCPQCQFQVSDRFYIDLDKGQQILN